MIRIEKDVLGEVKMKNDEVIIRVGGAAGDGVQSAGLILAKVFSKRI